MEQRQRLARWSTGCPQSKPQKRSCSDVFHWEHVHCDFFSKKVLHSRSPSDPEAWKLFILYFPLDSNEIERTVGLEASILKCCVTTDQSRTLPSEEYDDDVCIKASISGWNSIGQRDFDPVWYLVREIDHILLSSCGVVERIAMLRILRAVLLVSLSHTIIYASNAYVM